MNIKKGQLLEADVTDIAFGGRGLTRIDGLAVFVDQAVPGDTARIRIIKRKPHYAEARVAELIKPSPFRIDPPCEYSGFCGGCKWQFLNYDQQLVYKRRHVKDALEHIALIRGVPVHPTLPSPKVFGYRNKMEFSCSDRRWLLPSEVGRNNVQINFALGLHVPGTFHRVIDTRACLLQPDLGNRILEDVRQFMKSSAAPVYGLRSHSGYWRFLMLRHSVVYDHWMVNIVTASEDLPKLTPLADFLRDKYPRVVAVVNNITSRKAGVALGEFERPLAGSSIIRDRIGQFEFEISANSFFQTNTLGAEQLYAIVKAYAELSGKETVLDLYSGTGTIPILLSEAAQEIVGIELAASAVVDAENNCRRNAIKNCRFIQGDIRNCLSRLSKRPDVLIIDPPRAGMHKDIVKQVLEMAPERLVYVSCNPSTQARDLALMQGRYRVAEMQPVDMFPHTYHIESVAKLVKR
ncbi:MAG: 23S rRNA (uracil(1939)-C(5))-methyltransferase RlmD [Desulfobacterales bacterium]|nr:MAG: 23S rRNA (uracil(1939)-C(5))-methyltransferase RlmD [Desulfobacterales bacterium]